MTLRGKAVVGFVAVILLLSGSVGWGGTNIRDGDPNTIGGEITKPDGSTITLTCVQTVWRGRSGRSIAIKEWTEKYASIPRLLIVSHSSLPAEPWWSIDVTGVLQTMDGIGADGSPLRQRVLVVIPSDIKVYCDSRTGKPYPLFNRNLFNKYIYKRPFSDFIINSECDTATTDLPLPPDAPDPVPPVSGSQDNIKLLTHGARISVNGAIVYAVFKDFFFVERSDRSFGMKIRSPQPVSVGDIVDATGQIQSSDASMTVDTVTVLDSGASLPSIVGMNNKFLGWSLDTTGMMVRAWGKVTYVDPQNELFYINDGSDLPADYSGTNPRGVKIYSEDIALPAVDDFIAVNGSSDKEVVGSITVRTIWRIPEGGSSLTQSVPDTGSISGTLTAQGADGQTARVYCGNKSATVKFVGDTASYELRVPSGRRAVTATLPGYKTTTRVAVVGGDTSRQDFNFTLAKSEMVVDLVIDSAQVLIDGTKKVIVRAIVRDTEGRRPSNQPISWLLDGQAMINANSVTDAVGEDLAVLRSPNEVVSEVTVQSGSARKTLSW